MIDYAEILSRRYKGQEWVLEGDDYSGLKWMGDQKKPTQKQLDKLWESVQNEIAEEIEIATNARKSALEKLSELGLTKAEIEALLSR